MGIFDGWKKNFQEATEPDKYEDNPEIKKLKEPIKVNINERGQAQSERYFKEQLGLTQYAREANYINTDSNRYKDDTTRRYQAGYHSGLGSKAPNLNRGMGVAPNQGVNGPHKSYHSEQLGPMGKLGCAKPLGMGPIGMEGNDAVKSNPQDNQQNSGSGSSSGSRLTRPF